ncbi:MAG TPA: class I SAM-dependent methyltransferase, partial [Gaiellaceae bacterium]|nr:class I SAM-dependent methyltransferase [Gaiellaceae bacterium]
MSDLLGEQKRYYAERAPEYDDWWFRRGRYELEPEALARWQEDIAEVETALDVFAPRGSVLELAAGTGIWTRKLVRLADRVVAVDANAETLALNTADAQLVQADVFDWSPEEPVDVVFFSFWLSHVPEARFDEFWALVRAAIRPGGRVFLIDSGAGDTAHTATEQTGEEETRSLSDG